MLIAGVFVFGIILGVVGMLILINSGPSLRG